MNLPFFIARRYLARQKGAFSAFIIRLAILATALSVAVMIVAMAIVNGFNYAIREKLYSFMGHVHVVLFDESHSNSLTPQPIYYDHEIEDSIRLLPHVVQVFPFVQRPAIVQAHGTMEGLKLKGVGKEYHLPPSIQLTGNSIDYTDTLYTRQIMLSRTTAEKLNVMTGDTVQLDFLEPNSMPRIRRVRVCGIYHTGMEEVDKNFGICDIRMLQRLNNWTADSINGFQVELNDEAFADTTAAYIHEYIVPAPLEAYTTTENYSFIFDWLQLQGMNGTILLVIMAVVAIINMGAVLLILMVDRAAMIGLLKALGMTFETTRTIFLSIAALIGLVGIALGNILAFELCWLQLRFGIIRLSEDVYYMRYAPIRMIWWQIGVIDLVTLMLCVVCMWIPAYYIRRIQPARVLQFK